MRVQGAGALLELLEAVPRRDRLLDRVPAHTRYVYIRGVYTYMRVHACMCMYACGARRDRLLERVPARLEPLDEPRRLELLCRVAYGLDLEVVSSK